MQDRAADFVGKGLAASTPLPTPSQQTPSHTELDVVSSLQCVSLEQPDNCADSWGEVSTPDACGKENVAFVRKPSLLSNAPSSLLATTTVPGCQQSWERLPVTQPTQPVRGTIFATDACASDSESDAAGHTVAVDGENCHPVTHDGISSDLDAGQLAEVAAIQVRSACSPFWQLLR